ncbi:protein of unknown function DUF155 [Dillenia turbinata]|uniref:DUF155 domain-containing protein n=1 Tax=Dillenia turbinata TaxID=194707 RepID=A0AAN8UWE8_9MAGN
MGRWGASSLLINQIVRIASNHSLAHTPSLFSPQSLHFLTADKSKGSIFLRFIRGFSASSSLVPVYDNEFASGSHYTHRNVDLGSQEDEDVGKIPVKAYFLSTGRFKLSCVYCNLTFDEESSINLKSMQADNASNAIPPSSRSTNYIALRYCNFRSEISGIEVEYNMSHCRYMVVFQYGSAVLFNVADHEVETCLDIIRRHATGLLPEMTKDDYAIKEKPMLVEDMQGGPDHIILKHLDVDSIRVISSVLGQSIALDYFVSQVDGMVQEFTDINREMEKTGNFTMNRKKLFQLVGKANTNLADVILKVGLFDRSEIAWRQAKYAQIFEYLREEYEVAQRFGDLDYKIKFVKHNIHFLQEALQNRRSDLLEWCIIFLLTIENAIGVYEIIRDSGALP